MHFSAIVFAQQFSRFNKMVLNHSGRSFTSFVDGLPAEWEGYKQEIRREALHRLQYHNWSRAGVGKGIILERVIKAIEIHDTKRSLRNNLVTWQNRYGHKSRSHRALLDAQSDMSARRNFEQWLLDFFQGRLSEPEAFESFCQLAGNRYDIVAYLFFLKDWNRFMPIAPTTFDEAFRLLGIDLVTANRCSWENYACYNEALLEIRDSLQDIAEIADARLIDAHSFCWMLVRLPMPDAPHPPVIPIPEILTNIKPPNLSPTPLTPDTDFDDVDDDHFFKRQLAQRRLGKLAQDIALQAEQKRLRKAGHKDPEAAVKPVWNQPAHGYDILSCDIDGAPRYIEVKAARHWSQTLSFFLSRNELEKSKSLPNYHFYLVLDALSHNPTVFDLGSGKVSEDFLSPIAYYAKVSGFPSIGDS